MQIPTGIGRGISPFKKTSSVARSGTPIGRVEPHATSSALVFCSAAGFVRLHRSLRIPWRRGPEPAGDDRSQTEADADCCFRPGLDNDHRGCISHRAGRVQRFLPINLVLGGVAAFIGYGRLFVRPIAPASITIFRAVTGLAVLGTLVFVGYAPVWYNLTHAQ